ncbi:MAG: S41 family peptidase, partial [Thiohalocapsa sp.]
MRKSILAAAIIVVLAPTTALPQTKNGNSGVYEQLNLFGEAFERIRRDAVEAVSDKKLVETAIAGMLTSLDPRQAYLTEAEYKAQQTPEAASGSTGLVVTLEKGTAKVVAPRADSPAAAAGIDPGDVIYSIDKEPTYDMTLAEIEQKLRGPVDSEVTLMLRHGTGTPKEVKVKRAIGGFGTVSGQLEGGDIAYIRLAGFDDKTASALQDSVKNLRTQAGNKMLGLILDLRNNPGGSFDAAVKTADLFIGKGDITVIKSRKA